MKKKVFHFVPSLDIGGVEIAIEKSLPELRRKFDISIFYVKRPGSLHVGQLPWWRALRNIFISRPDVVITSLWWAHPFGFLFKLTGVRWVCFIHNSQFANFVDRLICTASIRFSDEIAADSEQAEVFVCSIKKTANVHVIPYIFSFPQCAAKIDRIKNSFIYVGRNAKEKRIDLVISFFKYLLSSFPETLCRFVIVGDVPADIVNLIQMFEKRVVVELNLSNSEVFDRLCASEYFVVLSDLEGFCMTAYEAVQAGCFIVYRDVGEIKKYVIPAQSFKVESLERFNKQLGEILVRRNEVKVIGVENFGSELRSSFSDTYVSCFVALVEGDGR